MKILNKKKIIIIIAVVLVVGLALAALFIPINPSSDKPAMTIACISDPHHEYGVQDTDSHTRPSSETGVELIKELTGGVDLVLLGGDITGRNGNWNDNTIKSTIDASVSLFSSASKKDKIMIATGNHDPEPTVHTATDSINSNDYSEYMKNSLGNYKNALYSEDIDDEFKSSFNELLCYRYDINGMVFLGLNTPYGDRRDVKQTGYNGLYIDQVEWLEKELSSIGHEKTVFILCHYNVDSLYTVEVATTKVDTSEENASRVLLKELLSEYENAVYCYGHVHQAKNQALEKTIEQIKPICEDGATLCYMGSFGYYNDHFGGPLGETDPPVVQTTLINVYADRIEFSMVNVGSVEAYGGKYEIEPYVLKRETGIKTTLFNKIFG